MNDWPYPRIIDFLVFFAVISLSFVMPVVHAQTDTTAYNEILKPIQKIYDLVRYAATLFALLGFAFAAIQLIIAGTNTGKREKAKAMMASIVGGLFVIWAAPLVVPYLLQ